MKQKSRLQSTNIMIIIIICFVFLATVALCVFKDLDYESVHSIMGAFSALTTAILTIVGILNLRYAGREAVLSNKATTPEMVTKIIGRVEK